MPYRDKEKQRQYYSDYCKRYREAHPEKGRERGRRYREAHPEILNERCRIWRQKNPRKQKNYEKFYREFYPEKFRAKLILRNAVVSGKIIKPDYCQHCLNQFPKAGIQGHHEDYSKPLEVVWLCRKCHGKTWRKSDMQTEEPTHPRQVNFKLWR